MAEALEKVKNDLGRDAVILHTRTIRKGGVLGIGSRSIIEITASRDLNVLPPSERRAIIGRRSEQRASAPGRESTNSPSDTGSQSAWTTASRSRDSAAYASRDTREGRYAASDPAQPSDQLTRNLDQSADSDLYTPFTRPRAGAESRRRNAPEFEHDSSSQSSSPPERSSLANPLRSAATPEMFAFTSTMQREMGELRSMVRQLLSRPSTTSTTPSVVAPEDLPEDLQKFYTDLIQNEVAEEIARDVIARAHERIEAARAALRRRNEQRKAQSDPKVAKESEGDGATEISSTKRATTGKRRRTTKKADTPADESPDAGQAPSPPTSESEQRKGLSEQEVLREIIPVVLREVIEQMIPEAEPVEITPGKGPHCVALTGPTGVGKTTTIAKLAAHFKLREGRRVGLITIDTYRIAAVDQLKAYAEILYVPLEVVLSPEEMIAALERMRDYDLILIDTSGRSQRDAQRLSELGTFLDAARRTAADQGGRLETHLVLSCIAHPQQLAQVTERFSVLGLDRVVFTKLDEAVGLGVIFNTIRRLNVKLSYLTTGQDVPDHLEIGHRRRIAELVLKGLPEESREDSSPQGAPSVDAMA